MTDSSTSSEQPFTIAVPDDALALLLVDARAGALALNPVVAGRLETAVAQRPHFRADRLGEVARVRDDEHTTLELLERLDESGERLTIEVVC